MDDLRGFASVRGLFQESYNEYAGVVEGFPPAEHRLLALEQSITDFKVLSAFINDSHLGSLNSTQITELCGLHNDFRAVCGILRGNQRGFPQTEAKELVGSGREFIDFARRLDAAHPSEVVLFEDALHHLAVASEAEDDVDYELKLLNERHALLALNHSTINAARNIIRSAVSCINSSLGPIHGSGRADPDQSIARRLAVVRLAVDKVAHGAFDETTFQHLRRIAAHTKAILVKRGEDTRIFDETMETNLGNYERELQNQHPQVASSVAKRSANHRPKVLRNQL